MPTNHDEADRHAVYFREGLGRAVFIHLQILLRQDNNGTNR